MPSHSPSIEQKGFNVPRENIPLATSSSVANTSSSWAFANAMRLGDFTTALQQMDALNHEQQNLPLIRYAKARALMEKGKNAEAMQFLADLETLLPSYRSLILRYRAQCAFAAGHDEEAAHYYENSSKPDELLKAAIAYDRVGKTAEALRIAQKILTTVKNLEDAKETSVRMLRATLSTEKKTKLADYRWIAMYGQMAEQRQIARAQLKEAKQPLSLNETIHSLQKFARVANQAEVIAEINSLRKEKHWKNNQDLFYWDALAHYKARKDKLAEQMLLKASLEIPSKRQELIYYYAKVLARMGRDNEAISRLQDFKKEPKKSQWTDLAQYFKARLLFQNGDFLGAEKEYANYLATYSDGNKRDEAAYDLALIGLLSNKPVLAKKHFARLTKNAVKDEWARLREIEGVANLRAGDAKSAITMWTEVTTKRPLSWGAMLSRARLKQNGGTIPPLIAENANIANSVALPAIPSEVLDLVSIGLNDDAETLLESLENQMVQKGSENELQTACFFYSATGAAQRRYQIGVARVSESILMLDPGTSWRWAWDCVYPKPYEYAVTEASRESSVSDAILYALMRQESAFDPSARSTVGARGLMQLMPETAARTSEKMGLSILENDLEMPCVNIRLGAAYFSKLMQRFGNNVPLAVAAYNAGPGAVARWVSQGKNNEIDLWAARIPYEETRNYVSKVMGNWFRYQWLQSGDSNVSDVTIELNTELKSDDPNDY